MLHKVKQKLFLDLIVMFVSQTSSAMLSFAPKPDQEVCFLNINQVNLVPKPDPEACFMNLTGLAMHSTNTFPNFD